jgi:hypothetical protein
VLPLCFVKKVKQLSVFSLIADVTLVVGMAIVLYYDDCSEVYNMEVRATRHTRYTRHSRH